MAVNVDAVGEKIFNLMKGFGLEVKSFNTDGKISINPQEATRFVVAEPNMIVRYDKPNQTIQFATSTTESTEQLRLMLKDLATDNLQNFDFKVFDRKLEPKSEKIDIAQKQETDMADVLEGFGAMTGSTKTSYQGLENVKIVVRHKKAVNEEVRGARSRNIHSIFIQRGDERFKMAENNLKAARAMARHIQKGGEMHDAIGESITEMAAEHRTLKEFVRYVKKGGLVNETNEEYVNIAIENITNIAETLQKLAGAKTYANTSEGILDRNQMEILEDDLDLESKFTETHFDDRVANAVTSIKGAMARRTQFEESITQLVQQESFNNLKNILAEDEGVEFISPAAKLSHQVSQMSSSSTNPMLGNYLNGISKKIGGGQGLSQFEYSTIKSCLLSVNEPQIKAVAEDHSAKFEAFMESLDIL
jgi:hypothetical protein|tara:strand:+ start:286 stop:1542 length:1257 start_codon:yes stop_codon:yes gene_type:complete